jgi:hypothetical protein
MPFQAADAGSHPTSVEIILGVATLIGGIGTIVSGLGWARSRNKKRTIDTILDRWTTQFTAETSEADLAQLRASIESLQRQIGDDIPREARRAYLDNRIASVGSAIGELFEEYRDIEKELQGSAKVPLQDTLRRSIETTIMPTFAKEQRRSRQLWALLVLVVLLLVVPAPFAPNEAIWRYFQVTYTAAEYPFVATLASVLVAAGCLAVPCALLLGWVVARRPRFPRRSILAMLSLSWALLDCFVFLDIWQLRESASGPKVEFVTRTSLEQSIGNFALAATGLTSLALACAVVAGHGSVRLGIISRSR